MSVELFECTLMRHLILLTCLTMLPFWGKSQQPSAIVLLSGTLLDAQTQAPVPYGAVRIEGRSYGAISNAEGGFELKVPRQLLQGGGYLRVSSIGYHNYRYPLSKVQQGQHLMFRLRERPYTLQEVMIYSIDLSARELVAAAFERIPDNYGEDDYLLRTFYRHYCKEGDDYGRLIEAAVDIYDRKGHKKLQKRPAKKVELNVRQLRRSFDFTNTAIENRHMPIALYSTLQHDLVSYQSRLQRSIERNNYEFAYTDTTFYDDQLVYVVSCSRKDYRNTMYISAADLAFLKFDEERYVHTRTDAVTYWRKEHYEATYQRQDGRYYLKHLVNEGENQTVRLDSAGNEQSRTGHAHHVEIMTNQVLTEGFEKFRGHEPDAEELLNVPYDADFWASYNILKATPLESEIEEDLARRMPLEQQFANFHRQESDPYYHDRLMAQLFDHRLNQLHGKVTLVYFWDSDRLPSLREILLVRKMAKTFEGASMEVMLISMDEQEADWRKQLDKYELGGGGNFRLAMGAASPLAKRYGVAGAPHYLIFDKEGRLAVNTATLPSSKQIEQELRRLLNM